MLVSWSSPCAMVRPMALRPWTFAVLFLWAACDGGGSPPDATVPLDAGAVSVTLGTGQEYWEDIPPSGVMTLIHGPQGGYHVYGRVRLMGFAPDVTVTFTVTPDDGGAVINAPQPLHQVDHRGLIQVGNDYESAAPNLVILTQIHSPAEVVGMHFTLAVTVVETGTERMASTSLDILIQDSPTT